jgi:hypothetical protein
MSGRVIRALFMSSALAASAVALPTKHQKDANAPTKAMRHDAAFRAGYGDGWGQGANDAEALSSSYKDESGPLFEEANDGYTHKYGDYETYRKLFRLGYIAGYKAGWDYNVGQYCSFGCAGGGP